MNEWMLVCCPGRVLDNFSIHDDFYSGGKIHSSILPLLKVSRYTTEMIRYYAHCPYIPIWETCMRLVKILLQKMKISKISLPQNCYNKNSRNSWPHFATSAWMLYKVSLLLNEQLKLLMPGFLWCQALCPSRRGAARSGCLSTSSPSSSSPSSSTCSSSWSPAWRCGARRWSSG